MQVLLLVSDYIILNLLFVICCIPIVTIGAAQSGLYRALRVIREKDTGCISAFFKGFASGFGTVTVIWTGILAIMAVLVICLLNVVTLEQADVIIPTIMCLIALVLCMIYQGVLPVFHARFGCTVRQLLSNVICVVLSYPVRSIIVAVLMWFPAILLVVSLPYFLKGSIIWIGAYYSLAFSLNEKLMRKPMERLEEQYLLQQGSEEKESA